MRPAHQPRRILPCLREDKHGYYCPQHTDQAVFSGPRHGVRSRRSSFRGTIELHGLGLEGTKVIGTTFDCVDRKHHALTTMVGLAAEGPNWGALRLWVSMSFYSEVNKLETYVVDCDFERGEIGGHVIGDGHAVPGNKRQLISLSFHDTSKTRTIHCQIQFGRSSSFPSGSHMAVRMCSE